MTKFIEIRPSNSRFGNLLKIKRGLKISIVQWSPLFKGPRLPLLSFIKSEHSNIRTDKKVIEVMTD